MDQFYGNTWTTNNNTSGATYNYPDWDVTAATTTVEDAVKAYMRWQYYPENGKHIVEDRLTIPSGRPIEVELPDGSVLCVDDKGNYRIDDKEAKVIYQANRMRDWSPHLNASDMVARFVEYTATLGVRKQDVMNLPLHLFISWLIIEAAERDGDDIPESVQRIECDPVLVSVKKPRCLVCGRFIKRLHYRNRFPFCDPIHAQTYLEHSA